MKSRMMTWTEHMAHIGEGRGAKIVLAGKLRERDHFEDLAIDGRIILKLDLQKIGRGGNWNDVAQNRDRWRAFVKAVMNPPIPYNAGNFLTS